MGKLKDRLMDWKTATAGKAKDKAADWKKSWNKSRKQTLKDIGQGVGLMGLLGGTAAGMMFGLSMGGEWYNYSQAEGRGAFAVRYHHEKDGAYNRLCIDTVEDLATSDLQRYCAVGDQVLLPDSTTFGEQSLDHLEKKIEKNNFGPTTEGNLPSVRVSLTVHDGRLYSIKFPDGTEFSSRVH